MKIYLAARYSHQQTMLLRKQVLELLGHEVTSRWVLGNHQLTDEELAQREGIAFEKQTKFALEDYIDVDNADMVVNFTEWPRSSNSRGGRHVEFGLGLGLGKQMVVVGPRENVFHCLPDVQTFSSFEGFLEWLKCDGTDRR